MDKPHCTRLASELIDLHFHLYCCPVCVHAHGGKVIGCVVVVSTIPY